MKKYLLVFVLLVGGFLHLNAQVQNSNAAFVADVAPDNFHNVDTSSIFDLSEVEVSPEFPGGMSEMNKFIQKNLVYPVEASKNGIAGKVWVMFDVEKNGKLTNLKVVKPVNPKLDEEALRIVKLMPNFNSGKIQGKYVKVKNYTIPVSFKLD